MSVLLLAVAAAVYVAGGMAMKYSDGLRVLVPSVMVFVCFCSGAALQTIAMRTQTLGVGYVLVLGLEAVLAVLAGVLLLSETMMPRQLAGVVLVVFGIVLLKWGS